jgi:hypothetical protein
MRPSAKVIRRGKAKQPTEFGKMIKVQEAEAQIITDYQVYEKRPSDSDLLAPAIEVHQERLGCARFLLGSETMKATPERTLSTARYPAPPS